LLQLWDDLGNMRSEFKKAARPIVQSQYPLFREAERLEDDDDAAKYIKNGVKELLDMGKFLQGGLDDQVRIKSLDWY
jgi:hypothetical protein